MLICGRSQADLRETSLGLRELVQDRLLASSPGGIEAEDFTADVHGTVGREV